MDQEDEGLSRTGVVSARKEKPALAGMLMLALALLGYGFYTRIDQARALLWPADEPVAQVPPAPPPPRRGTRIEAPATQPKARLRIERPAPVAEAAPSATAVAPTPAPAPATPAREPAASGPGPASPPLQRLYAMSDRPAQAPTPGKAGMVEALRRGELRLATPADFNRWKAAHRRNGGRLGRSFDERTSYLQGYVVRRDFVIPDGLNGAHSVFFLLEAGAPYPLGEAG
ncbi:MAG: hypothetical protein EON95_20055, partial [Caulobacteraceae bacterium]